MGMTYDNDDIGEWLGMYTQGLTSVNVYSNQDNYIRHIREVVKEQLAVIHAHRMIMLKVAMNLKDTGYEKEYNMLCEALGDVEL